MACPVHLGCKTNTSFCCNLYCLSSPLGDMTSLVVFQVCVVVTSSSTFAFLAIQWSEE